MIILCAITCLHANSCTGKYHLLHSDDVALIWPLHCTVEIKFLHYASLLAYTILFSYLLFPPHYNSLFSLCAISSLLHFSQIVTSSKYRGLPDFFKCLLRKFCLSHGQLFAKTEVVSSSCLLNLLAASFQHWSIMHYTQKRKKNKRDKSNTHTKKSTPKHNNSQNQIVYKACNSPEKQQSKLVSNPGVQTILYILWNGNVCICISQS